MSSARYSRNELTNVVRAAAAILFMLMVGMGYAISPQLEGVLAAPIAAAELEITEPAFLPSDCAVDGLVFADCDLEF